MALIGSIDIAVGATTKKLAQGLKSGSQMLAGFAKRVTSILKGFSVAGLAGVASLGGVAFGINRIAGEVEDLAQVSDKLNIPIDRLQGLQNVAEKTGVGATALNTALQRMTRRLSEASKRGGGTKDSIEELGLSVEDLINKTPDEAFLDITDAMEGVENQADKVRLAFSLFDTEGVGLVNTMALGSDEIRRQTDLLEGLGIALDRDAAAQVETFNGMWTDFLFVADAVSKKLVAELGPTLVAIGETIFANSEGVVDLGQTVDNTVDFIIEAIALLLNGLELMSGGFKIAQGAVASWSADLASAFRWVTEQFGELTESQKTFFEAWEEEANRTADDLTEQGFKKLERAIEGLPALEFKGRVAELDTEIADKFAQDFDQQIQETANKVIERTRPALALEGTTAAASQINRSQKKMQQAAEETANNTLDTTNAVNELIREFRLTPSATLIRL